MALEAPKTLLDTDTASLYLQQEAGLNSEFPLVFKHGPEILHRS